MKTKSINLDSVQARNEATALANRITLSLLGLTDFSPESIRVWQFASAGVLAADGIFGPKSVKHFYRLRQPLFLQHMAGKGIAIDTTTYVFKPGKGAELRVSPPVPRMVVWHDSVTRTAAKCFMVLKAKHYSTCYMIDEDGRIYQCHDPLEHRSVHSGALNEESIGIDMINVLDPSILANERGDADRRERIVDASWSASEIDGKAIDYTDAQKRSAVALAEALSIWFLIPRQIPESLTTYGKKVDWVRESYEGHVAHAQWSTKRWDGLFMPQLLEKAGFQLTNGKVD